MLLAICSWGTYVRDKNTCARSSDENIVGYFLTLQYFSVADIW